MHAERDSPPDSFALAEAENDERAIAVMVDHVVGARAAHGRPMER